jgi:hypothetical protein
MSEKHTHSTIQAQGHQPGENLMPSGDLVDYFRHYARERPEVVALWCLGIGFVLGWKLKTW